MKRLYTSEEGSRLELLEDLMEQNGITCNITASAGMVPFTEEYPEIWVPDEDYEKAKELLDAWLEPAEKADKTWVCPNCGETIEAAFSSCWKCAGEKST
jgi:rubrerythrin